MKCKMIYAIKNDLLRIFRIFFFNDLRDKDVMILKTFILYFFGLDLFKLFNFGI